MYQSETKPVFRYYRYYRTGDTLPLGSSYGEIDTGFTPPEPLTSTEAQYITKVTVAFTLLPKGKEPLSFDKDRGVPIEDSAVFRLAPASETASNPNLPCTEKT